MTKKDFQELLPSIPKQPGIYKYRDAEGTIIYIGKAKNLRSRMSSYFNNDKNKAFKTRTLIKNAVSLEYTVVETEHDALLLENNMIKKFQPRYNVLLKDAKSYTYICIKKERFPRVFFTRKVIKDGSQYFGPYTSKFRTKIILDIIKKLFQLRTCNLNLDQKHIDAGKYKVCLEYHIKNCLGPCVNYESEEDYNAKIEQVINILKGHFKPVKEYINTQMAKHAEVLDFEKAQALKDKLFAFEDYQAKSMVVNPKFEDLDVFAIRSEDNIHYIAFLKIVNGAMLNTDVVEVISNADETPEEVLSFTIDRLREKFNSIAPDIIVPMEVMLVDQSINQSIPVIGDKKKLIELAEKNLKYYILQTKKEALNKIKKQTPAERILTTLRDDLSMDRLPLHIECFDNSNIQGTNPVASCVVFKNAKPAKSDYRKFKIKTVIGPDDFASMTEVVGRRYKRLLEEEQPLPQLVIIDGGKGQLSASMIAIDKLGLRDKITVIGIAKRLEEIYFPEDSIPIYINKKSESLKLIQQLRNEAHRFAINFHRDLRSKGAFGTGLTEIPGIGAKTAEKLLKEFKSVTRLMQADKDQVEQVIGLAAAKKIFAYFEGEEEE